MSDSTSFEQEIENKTGTLKVLTILTFIGSAWDLYQNLKQLFGGKEAIEKLQDAQDKIHEAPAFVQKLAGPEVLEFATKAYENKIPLGVIGLIATGLCIFGAIEMRKQKLQGYYIWLMGEVLPIVAMLIFTGALIFKTIMVWFLVFPLIFILLYTLQRKNLINK